MKGIVAASSISRDVIVLTLRIGTYDCAFRADQVQEIIAIPATIKVPGQPSILEGFVNLRGTVIPVIRMAAFFNMVSPPDLHAPVIIIRTPSATTAFLADEVDSVLTVSSDDLHPLQPNHTATEFAESEFVADDRNYVLLDCDRLLLSEERRRIGELQSQINQRRRAIEAPDR